MHYSTTKETEKSSINWHVFVLRRNYILVFVSMLIWVVYIDIPNYAFKMTISWYLYVQGSIKRGTLLALFLFYTFIYYYRYERDAVRTICKRTNACPSCYKTAICEEKMMVTTYCVQSVIKFIITCKYVIHSFIRLNSCDELVVLYK